MEASVFSARVFDTAKQCERTSVPKFLGFLSPDEAATANDLLKKYAVKYQFFGGYNSAERTILACLPDWCDETEYPVSGVTFGYRVCDNLSHRDFLGSLMGLGITRESVGDILVENGRAVVFLKNEILDFVLSQIDKVGRCGVEVHLGFDLPLPEAGVLTSFSDTIASLRLDCVVSSLCGCSRNTACEMISDSRVSVNSLSVQKTTKMIASGDRITIRGKGKFIIDSADEFSKKGRIILKYSKYV